MKPTILLIAAVGVASRFEMPPGTDCIVLPSLHKDEKGQYLSRRLKISLQDIVKLRAKTIEAALVAFDPQVLIADTEPRGAFGELDRALSRLRAAGTTTFILGMRDIRDHPSVVHRQWKKSFSESAIRKFYDEVWIYGDKRVYDVVREYAFSETVAAKLSYTGYLDQRLRLNFLQSEDDGVRILETLGPAPLVLCTVGGGQDGALLAEAFIQADLPPDSQGILLAGPDMPLQVLDRLRSEANREGRLRMLRFLAEPVALLERADRVITMGGYNSTLEVLSFNKRALIVPRVKPRAEQWIRAERLRERGLVDVLHPDQLTPEALTQWLRRPFGPGADPRHQIDLEGLSQIIHLLGTRLAGKPQIRENR